MTNNYDQVIERILSQENIYRNRSQLFSIFSELCSFNFVSNYLQLVLEWLF